MYNNHQFSLKENYELKRYRSLRTPICSKWYFVVDKQQTPLFASIVILSHNIQRTVFFCNTVHPQWSMVGGSKDNSECDTRLTTVQALFPALQREQHLTTLLVINYTPNDEE